MRKLILNDGTEYELDWGHSDKGIFNANIITDATFPELAAKFYNPEATKKMITTYGSGEEKVHEGFTELRSISFDQWRTGTVLITMTIPGLPY